MRIAYGADDENATTRAVVEYLSKQGHEVVPATTSERWPDIGEAVGRYVAALWADLREEASKGLSADEAALGAVRR